MDEHAWSMPQGDSTAADVAGQVVCHCAIIRPQLLSRTRLDRKRARGNHFLDMEAHRPAHLLVDMQRSYLVAGGCFDLLAARSILNNVDAVSQAVWGAAGQVILVQHKVGEAAQRGRSDYYEDIVGQARRTLLAGALKTRVSWARTLARPRRATRGSACVQDAVRHLHGCIVRSA